MSERELQVRDLLLKLQVLTYGLLQERKKSQSYLDRIKELQDTLQKKETEVVDLTKIKFNLQSQLSLELAKKNTNKKNDGYISSFISKIREKPVDQGQITELEEKINQQSFEIKDLSQRLMEEKENFDQQKIKFQTMLTLQTSKMSEIQKELEKEKEKGKEIIKNIKPVVDTESKEKLQALTAKYNYEKGEFEKKLNNLMDELNKEKKNRDEIDKLKSQLEEVQAELQMKQIENQAMKGQVIKLDKDCVKLKIELRDSKLSEKIFQIEKVEDNLVKNRKPMILIFRWIKGNKTDKARCEAVFKLNKGGTIKEDKVNFLDFELKHNPNYIINNLTKEISQLNTLVSNMKKEMDKMKNEFENKISFLEMENKNKSIEIKTLKEKLNKEDEIYDLSDSDIILLDEREDIIKMINPSANLDTYNFKLIFKASIDGGFPNAFHNHCDNRGPTIIFFKINNGKRIGGYTSISWESNDEFKDDEDAFLFSLDRKEKYELNTNQLKYAVAHYGKYGPTWGSGYGLYISNNYKSEENCSQENNCYKNKNIDFVGIDKSKAYFSIFDYEVYTCSSAI